MLREDHARSPRENYLYGEEHRWLKWSALWGLLALLAVTCSTFAYWMSQSRLTDNLTGNEQNLHGAEDGVGWLSLVTLGGSAVAAIALLGFLISGGQWLLALRRRKRIG